MANDIGQRGKALMTKYGNVSAISVGAIQRRLLVLEEQGANNFFGEPALDIKDFIRTAPDGRGVINILAADKLMKTPRLYATFLLWMLAQLFDKLPEVGDPEKPKLVFFFDEAHLLFNEAPEGAAGAGRARHAPDPLQGRRRLLRHAEPARRAQLRLGPARQPHPARAARLHAHRAEGHPRRRRDLPPQPQARYRARDPGAEGRRGAGVGAARRRRAVDGPAHADPPAVGPHRPRHAGGAQGDDRGEPHLRQVRGDGRPRVGLRDAAEARGQRPQRRQNRRRTAGATS